MTTTTKKPGVALSIYKNHHRICGLEDKASECLDSIGKWDPITNNGNAQNMVFHDTHLWNHSIKDYIIKEVISS